jgi:hypothetical protein
MNKAVGIVLLGLLLAAPALAADKALTPQQEKMKSCNAEATSKGMKADARKQFMASCLKADGAPAAEKALTPQQEKMKSCNGEATSKGLKGDARKQFMSTCLKGG